MGWKYVHGDGISCPTCGYEGLYERDKEHPSYSTDIASAWQVVEKLNTLPGGEYISLTRGIPGIPDPNYRVQFCVAGVLDNAEAPTAPHAICLAALKAVDAI